MRLSPAFRPAVPGESIIVGRDASADVLIDGLLVNGSAKVVGAFSAVVRKLQTGFIYSYATAMIIGVLGLMTIWFSGLIAH